MNSGNKAAWCLVGCWMLLGGSLSAGLLLWSGSQGPGSTNSQTAVVPAGHAPPQLQLPLLRSNGTVLVNWSNGYGPIALEASDSLNNWAAVTQVFTRGEVYSYSESGPTNPPQRYYRLRLLSDPSLTSPAREAVVASSQEDNAPNGQAGPISGEALLDISPPTLPQGIVGTSYDVQLAASGGLGPYTFSVNAKTLPAGLRLSKTGDLSGTPQTPGSSSFTVTVADKRRSTGSRSYTLQVVAAVAIPDPQLQAAVACALPQTNSGPLTAADLQRLTRLAACNAQVTNLSGLESATSLTNLELTGNAIADLGPLRNLPGLRELSLEGNRVSGLSPLAGLTNLRSLSLGGNPIGDYSPLGGLTNLTTLSIAHAATGSGMRSLALLSTLPRLTSLVLWNNAITDLTALAGLTNLTCLDLRGNAIAWNAANQAVLAGLTNLSALYLGETCLSNLDFVTNLTSLTLLSVGANGIEQLPALGTLRQLKYLALSQNPLTNYSVLSTLSGLEGLELRGNGLTNVAFLSSLCQLTYADLAGNAISDLSPLAGLTDASLVLEGNTNLTSEALLGLTNVSRLWLGNTGLSDLEFVRPLRRLRGLSLEGNLLQDVSALTTQPATLEHLALSRNPVTNCPVLACLTNLTSLRLDGNNLGNNASFLANLSRLVFLSVNDNYLADLSAVSSLSSLSSLYISGNRLTNSEPLGQLPGLRWLDMSLNPLDPAAAAAVANELECPWAGVGAASFQYLPTR